MNGLEKRRQMFYRFSNQLHLLKEKEILNIDLEYDRTYICPICLRHFSEQHLQESKGNFLTLEDAPPDALGGSKIALTCKQCNSECGYKIDVHLIEALGEIDASYFYKDTVRKGSIEFEDKRVTVELTSLGGGTLQAYHRIKNNDPSLLDRFIYALKEKNIGPLLNFQPPKSKVIENRVNFALVKSSYILTFAKFGYIFLLHPAYDLMHKQLLEPDENHYRWSPFIKDQFKSQNVGTYYLQNPGIESILNVFSLKTGYSETIIAGSVPFPFINTQTFAQRVNNMRDCNNGVVFSTRNYDPNADLFTDWTEIFKVIAWVFQKRN